MKVSNIDELLGDAAEPMVFQRCFLVSSLTRRVSNDDLTALDTYFIVGKVVNHLGVENTLLGKDSSG